jgi:hypothetical protein
LSANNDVAPCFFKGNDKKEIVTQREEDVAALYTSSVKAMTFVFDIKAVADMIQLRYRTLSKRFKTIGFDVWEQIQVLERDGLAAVSATEKAEAKGEKVPPRQSSTVNQQQVMWLPRLYGS